MAITVRCECGKEYRFPEGVSGKKECSDCGRWVTVRRAENDGGEPDASPEVDSTPHEPAPAKGQMLGWSVTIGAAVVVSLVAGWWFLHDRGVAEQQGLKDSDRPSASDKVDEATKSSIPDLFPEPPAPKEHRIAGWPSPVPSPAVVPKFSEPTEFEHRPIDLQYDVSPIVAVDISRDGKRLACASMESAGRPGELTVWDLDTKQVLLTLEMSPTVRLAKFSPTGELLAAACLDGTVKLVDLASGKVAAILDAHESVARLLAFLNEGTQLATGGTDGVFKLWDVKSRAAVKTQTLGGPSNSVIAMSSDGQTLASVDRDWAVTIWDAQTGHAGSKLETNTRGTRFAAFSLEGDLLATAGYTQAVQLWDVEAGQLKSTVTSPAAPVYGLHCSPDGKVLAVVGMNGRVSLLELPSGRELVTINSHADAVSCLAFAPNSKTLATGSSDKSVKVWELDRYVGQEANAGKTTTQSEPAVPDLTGLVRSLFGTQKKSLDRPLAVFSRFDAEHIDSPQSTLALALSPDGEILASAHGDNSVRIRDAQTGEVLKVLAAHSDAVTSLAFSPDGTTLASTSRDGTAKLWDVSSGKPSATLQGHSGMVSSIDFSPNGKTVATAGADKTARLWEIATGKQLAIAAKHTGPVNAIVFSPNEEVLATASDDKAIRLWNADDLTEQATLTGHTASVRTLAFSPDSQALASGGTGESILLWDVGLRELRATCEWPSQTFRRMSGGKIVTESRKFSSQIEQLAFSPEGKTLASACTNGSVMLWDPQTGAHRNTLGGFRAAATSLAFAPDASSLVSGGADTTIKRWRASQPSGRLAKLPIGLYGVSAPAGSYEFHVAEDGPVSKKSVVIDGSGQRAGIVVGPVAMDQAKRHVARGWVKVEGSADTEATLTLDFYDAEGQQISTSSPGVVGSATSDWQRIALDLTAADNPPNAEFVAVTAFVTGQGKASFDDLALIAVDRGDLQENVLTNGGFESIAGPSVTDWRLHKRDATEFFIGPSEASPKAGRYCLHLKGNGTWVEANSRQRVRIEKGKTYILTGFVKTRTGTASLQLHYFSDEGGQWVGKTAPPAIESDDWQQLAVVAQTSQYPKAAEIVVSAIGRGDFEAWFDAFRLVVLDASQLESSPYAKLVARSTQKASGTGKADTRGLDGWNLYTSSGVPVTCRFDSQETKSGKPSLYLKGTCKWAYLTRSDRIKLEGRKAYMLTGSVKCKSGTAKLKISYYEGNKRVGDTPSRTVKPADGWQELSVLSQRSKYPTATHFSVAAGGGGNLEAWYADIEVTEK